MKRVLFTEENMRNLEVFLGRVDLKGSEAPGFISIVNALAQATDEKPVTKEGEK